jgi:glycosyltransferase involved in cell wall biosynthesis
MKKKILLLSDDLRMTSGISTMSKEIVMGTLDKFDWVQLGAAVNHLEAGKIVDVNEDVRKRTGLDDANLKIYPSNGYGDIHTLRRLIAFEKPDVILHFTDPHYWHWLYDAEHEIRQQVPILYYHVWDNLPDPNYNRDYYESCDWIGCISKQTYGLVKRVTELTEHVTQKKLEDWQVSYVPHGINSKMFRPLEVIDEDLKSKLCGSKEYDFILFYNNRNIRRKQPSDVIYAYKLFCDKLTKEQADKCLLLMHTTPVDNNGTDLPAVVRKLCPNYDVRFTNSKIEQDMLNRIYNIVDCTINIANNEGFGLTTAESIMAGTPIIVNVTGGLQDQCGFDYSADDYIKIGSLHNIGRHEDAPESGEWVIPVWPAAINLNGSPVTPYIYDDRVNNNDVAEAIKKMYDLGKEKRKESGLAGRAFAINNLSSEVMCSKIVEGVESTLKNYKPRKKYDIYKII